MDNIRIPLTATRIKKFPKKIFFGYQFTVFFKNNNFVTTKGWRSFQMNILEKIVILKCFLTCFWTITFRIYVFLRNDNFFPLEPSLQ